MNTLVLRVCLTLYRLRDAEAMANGTLWVALAGALYNGGFYGLK